MARARVTMKWFGPQVVKSVEDEMRRRLSLVGEMVASQIRRNISTSTRANGPSLPGGFPHADSGTLRKSIEWEVVGGKGMTLRVGTNIKYGLYLELGARWLAPRPFLRKTVAEMQREIADALTKPMRDVGDRRPGFFKLS